MVITGTDLKIMFLLCNSRVSIPYLKQNYVFVNLAFESYATVT